MVISDPQHSKECDCRPYNLQLHLFWVQSQNFNLSGVCNSNSCSAETALPASATYNFNRAEDKLCSPQNTIFDTTTKCPQSFHRTKSRFSESTCPQLLIDVKARTLTMGFTG